MAGTYIAPRKQMLREVSGGIGTVRERLDADEVRSGVDEYVDFGLDRVAKAVFDVLHDLIPLLVIIGNLQGRGKRRAIQAA